MKCNLTTIKAVTGMQLVRYSKICALVIGLIGHIDSASARYLQSDHIGLAGGVNTYTYAQYNPLRYTDPTGQFVPAIVAACAANPTCNAAVAAAISPTASAIGRTAIVVGVSSLVSSDSRYRNPQKVVRGGTCTVDNFTNGNGVNIDPVTGFLSGISVNTFPNTSIDELSKGIRNNQIGVTTIGDIEDAGGQVIPDQTRNNPYHAEVLGAHPQGANQLFTPTIPNPNK